MKITNKTAHYEYELFDKLESGVELSGPEVKSLFAGHASLNEAYIKFVGGELFLLNAHIHPYPFADISKINPKRTRKLLLHKKELISLQTKLKQKKLVLVPLAWYNRGNKIKLEIALAKPKKKWEKKEKIKKNDLGREMERELINKF